VTFFLSNSYDKLKVKVPADPLHQSLSDYLGGYFFFFSFYTAILSRQLKLDRFARPQTFGPDFGTEDPLLNGLENEGNINSLTLRGLIQLDLFF
jgi:hypothetical protein